jgi:hypothetical protein
MLLGQLSTTIEAQNCLEALATGTTEPAGLRWMAMMVLSQTDSAIAYRTLYRVLDNPRSDSTMVRDDKGTELPLSYWAIEFLDETSTGRDFLKTAPTRPRDNPRVWSLVVVWWMSAGDSSYWTIAEEVIRDQSYPRRSRELALQALIVFLGDHATGHPPSGWDLVTSVALARSEPPSLRGIASAALRTRPK